MYKNNIRHRAFEQFPCLASISSNENDEDLVLYSEYSENVQTRFRGLLMKDIPASVAIPFEVNVADADASLQETLIKLQSDEVLCAKFKDEECNIWKANYIATKYPLLWDKL